MALKVKSGALEDSKIKMGHIPLKVKVDAINKMMNMMKKENAMSKKSLHVEVKNTSEKLKKKEKKKTLKTKRKSKNDV